MLKDWLIELRKARMLSIIANRACYRTDNDFENEKKAWRKIKQIPKRLLNERDMYIMNRMMKG